jgi:DNA-binding LytR/AlgR family response regulator
MKLRILVVEDEFSILMDITRRLSKLGYEVVGTAMNYEEAMVSLLENKPDLILLDINLESKKNGIYIAEKIKENYPLPIIFITASSDPATFEEALKTKPMGFIIKPFKDEDLRNNIELAIRHFETNQLATEIQLKEPKPVFLKQNNQLENVNLDAILYLEAMDNYTKVFTNTKRFTINNPLKNIHIQLPRDKFIRVHKSYVVAISSIKAVDGNSIVLKSNELIPIGKTFRNDFINQLKVIE